MRSHCKDPACACTLPTWKLSQLLLELVLHWSTKIRGRISVATTVHPTTIPALAIPALAKQQTEMHYERTSIKFNACFPSAQPTHFISTSSSRTYLSGLIILVIIIFTERTTLCHHLVTADHASERLLGKAKCRLCGTTGCRGVLLVEAKRQRRSGRRRRCLW